MINVPIIFIKKYQFIFTHFKFILINNTKEHTNNKTRKNYFRNIF